MTLLPDNPFVFDIGAHYGETAQRLIADHGACKVISVEACWANFLRLKEAASQDERIVPIHAALLAEPGIALISRAAAQDGLSTTDVQAWSQIYPEAQFEPPEVTPAICYRTMHRSFGTPDYLKVDVEGAELMVLSPLTKAQEEGLPGVITFEFHGARSEDALQALSMLERIGYNAALWHEDEPTLDIRPSMSIPRVMRAFLEQRPAWGNFTVVR